MASQELPKTHPTIVMLVPAQGGFIGYMQEGTGCMTLFDGTGLSATVGSIIRHKSLM